MVPREIVWGLFPRLLGVVYLVAFMSLSAQIMGIAGSRGIAPLRHQLARAKEAYPGLGRFFETPTLFWLSSSDAALRALPLIGAASALVVIAGGPWSPWALLICWLGYLSFDFCMSWYPWDTLLLEAGFLALFLPGTETLPSVAALALPLPAVMLSFHWLVIRLMWGFAKYKFIGTVRHDDLYLRGFLAWMPLPNPIGWRFQHAPAWALRAAYAFMWFAEVLCPALAFFPGWPRLVGMGGMIGLMIGIQGTGNWGFFNLGYGLLATCLLDTTVSFRDLTLAGALASPVVHTVLLGHFFATLVFFALNSWASNTWTHWPLDELTWKRPWLRWLQEYYRWLVSFRVVGSYGVFPPRATPPIRTVPVLEGSNDGVHFQAYEFRHMPTAPHSKPPVVAPHHPRIDHALIYAGYGISDCDFFSSFVGAGKVFGVTAFSHYGWMHRLAQRLLEGEPSVLKLMGKNPFPEKPPRWIRISIRALTPAPLSARKEGRWWHVRHAAVVFPPMELDPLTWEHWLPPPELFHPDFIARRRRAPALKAMLAAAAAGTPHTEAVRARSDITAEEVEVFWRDLVPMIAATRGDWSKVDATAAEVQRRFGRAAMLRLERVSERYAYLMRTRLEPHLYGNAQPTLPKCAPLRLHFLAQEIILDGREAYERMLASPGLCVERAARQTDATALHLTGVLVNDLINYAAMTMRIWRTQETGNEDKMPGIYVIRHFLLGITCPGESWLPACKRDDRGEWEMIGFEGG